jgi:hypothetical protein
MNAKLAIAGTAGMLLLAACAPVPPPAPPAPPPVAGAPAPPSPPPWAERIRLSTFTCRDLLAAADDDRAYASMIFLGYRLALAHSGTVVVGKIEGIEEAALAACAASPEMTASRAFAEALAANRE